ncbi:MAG: hypothetical protein F4121_02840, partial [Acidimicrobiia bacterium]|nr:hypothetical protein [Acidimicrobiia bacterium]
MLPLLYVVRMDVEDDYLDEFVKWYDTRHGPDLIEVGFHSCNAYHSVVGGPFICNVYEVPDLEIFSSEAYVDVRRRDTQLVDEVLHKISNHSNTTYTQELTVGVPESALGPGSRPSRRGAVTSPVVSTLRLDIAEDAEEGFLSWYRADEAARQADRPGFIAGRVGRQHGKHPLFPSSQPDWIVLSEWATAGTARRSART